MMKPSPIRSDLSNQLLRAMPDPSFYALSPFLELVPMPVRTRLAESGRLTNWVHFIEDGIASVVNQSTRALQEIGIVGREGASCHMALLCHDVAPYSVFMQIEGQAYRARSEVVVGLAQQDPALRAVFVNYTHAFGIQLSQTAVANVQCNIGERLARWLLMVEDRVAQPTLNITHEFLASMLGVGRTGVTLALQDLEGAELIRTGRKRIEIRDRPKLEAYTGGYYGFAEQEYRRLMERPTPVAGIGPVPAIPLRAVR